MADDLATPIAPAKSRQRFVVPIAVPRAVAGVLGSIVGVFVLWALVVDDPFGGEPVAVISVDLTGGAASPGTPAGPGAKAGPDAKAVTAPPAAAETPAESGGNKTVTIIDGMSGQRQHVPLAEPVKIAGRAPIDPNLVESSKYGPIPKLGPSGARPADIYAQPVKVAGTGPRIAIVIGGLGIGASGTAEALGKLPPTMTLGFAPYGNDLDRLVARARGEGREVLLQVPMEPFDYPDNDPGPQTLLTTLLAEQNLDRLRWFMSRFQGYVGVANYMGARFTATEPAVAPVMRDTAKRGLIYFDDGTSARSLTSQIAGANNVAFAKADMVLDAVAIPGEIDSALTRLESMARERGVAVGIATALPVSIDRISQWAKAADARGIVLVPISVVANKPKPS